MLFDFRSFPQQAGVRNTNLHSTLGTGLFLLFYKRHLLLITVNLLSQPIPQCDVIHFLSLDGKQVNVYSKNLNNSDN